MIYLRYFCLRINAVKIESSIINNLYFGNVYCALHSACHHKVLPIELVEVKGQWSHLELDVCHVLPVLKNFYLIQGCQSCCV